MITKKQLGLGFIGIGITAVMATFIYDFLGAGQFQGVGPAQRLALIGAGAVILVGLSLLPFGDKPA